MNPQKFCDAVNMLGWRIDSRYSKHDFLGFYTEVCLTPLSKSHIKSDQFKDALKDLSGYDLPVYVDYVHKRLYVAIPC